MKEKIIRGKEASIMVAEEKKLILKLKITYFYYFGNKCSLISSLAVHPLYSFISENTSYFLNFWHH